MTHAECAKATRIHAGLEEEPILYADTDGYITEDKPPPHTAAEEYDMIVQAPLSESDEDSDDDYMP